MENLEHIRVLNGLKILAWINFGFRDLPLYYECLCFDEASLPLHRPGWEEKTPYRHFTAQVSTSDNLKFFRNPNFILIQIKKGS